MTRSAEFGTTVKQGVRAVQPDLVVHARREVGDSNGPRIGLVVSKAVGPAVVRHRVSRRLRHAVREVLADLQSTDRVVIRALPSSRFAVSARLRQEIVAGVHRAVQLMGQQR